MSKVVRLDRFLAQAGAGSRSDVKKQIRAGRILVNGKPAKNGDQKVDLEHDIILLDGKQIQEMVTPTVMMNKPFGVVSATQDNYDRTVLDLIKEPWAEKLFPMGRLDKDTEGLMILTGDGQMSHELLSPKKHVQKTYFAIVSGARDEGMVERFRAGVNIGEKHDTLPAELIFLPACVRAEELSKPEGLPLSEKKSRLEEMSSSEEKTLSEEMSSSKEQLLSKEKFRSEEMSSSEEMPLSEAMPSLEKMSSSEDKSLSQKISFSEDFPFWGKSISAQDLARCGRDECCVVITITEGKFHQIKRMFASQGREVHYLKRLAMGKLALDPALEIGQYRILTDEELILLRGK